MASMAQELRFLSSGFTVPLKEVEYGFARIIRRSPYTPYSIYLRGTLNPKPETLNPIFYLLKGDYTYEL